MNLISRLLRVLVTKILSLLLGIILLVGIAETLRHFDTPINQHPLIRQTIHKPM